MPVRVKVCGITNFEDAHAAVEAGADALGFIFFEGSPRYVEPRVAAEIVRALPPFIATVGVFVDEAPENVQAVLDQTRIGIAQLHGAEPPDFCHRLRVPPIKAFRVRDERSLDALPDFRGAACAFLLDSYVPGQHGGTGARFNWNLAVQAKAFGAPIILAGGLTVRNIADAVGKVAPFAVDVSSGVEVNPGRKDHLKLRDFIALAKAGH
jgi:phosphoribosylanthranilate isomerase